jgi:hypothetical protein
VGSYEGQGTRLPWDDRMVVTPPCEQALLHAYFAVAPIVNGTHMLTTECTHDMTRHTADRHALNVQSVAI